MLEDKNKEMGVETASSESKLSSEGRDGPSSEEDSVSILRSKAEGRIFPGTSWFDVKHLGYSKIKFLYDTILLNFLFQFCSFWASAETYWPPGGNLEVR